MTGSCAVTNVRINLPGRSFKATDRPSITRTSLVERRGSDDICSRDLRTEIANQVSPLPLTVLLGPCEPMLSVVSRLAGANGSPSMSEFLQDMGIEVRRALKNDLAVVQHVAELGDVDPKLLTRFTPVMRDGGLATLNGESLRTADLVQDRIRYCTACIREHAATAPSAPERSLALQAAWLVRHLRTCPAHDLPLLEAGAGLTRADALDVNILLAPELQAIMDERSDPPSRPASPVDRFVAKRIHPNLDGRSTWIDGLGMHKALMASMYLGAALTTGRDHLIESLGAEERHDAMEVGLGVLLRGADAVEAALNGLRSSPGKPQDTPRSRYAPFYGWMGDSKHRDDPGMAPLMNVVREHVLANWPLPPGHLVLGFSLPERRLHSVRTASQEWDVHPKTLRKALAAEGLVATTSSETADADDVFPVSDAQVIIEDLVGGVSFRDAQAIIGMPRTQMEVLIRSGILRTSQVAKGMRPCFLRSELERFAARIETALTPYDPSRPLEPLSTAVKMAKTSVALAMHAILDGKLRVSRRPGEAGYSGLVVDRNELRALAHGSAPPRELSLAAAARRLGLPTSVVKRLVAEGVVRARASLVPQTGMAMTAIEQVDLDRFEAEYVSLSLLADSLGRRPARLGAELAAQGVCQDTALSTKGTPIYRRRDLPCDLVKGGSANPASDGEACRSISRPAPAADQDPPNDAPAPGLIPSAAISNRRPQADDSDVTTAGAYAQAG